MWRPRRKRSRLFRTAKKNEEELPNAELLAPECEWAVLEDPLESEEPNEPEADESEAGSADDQEPEAHLKTSGSGGPGHPEELVTRDAPRRSRQQQGCERVAGSFVSPPGAPHSLRQVPAKVSQCLGSHYTSRAAWALISNYVTQLRVGPIITWSTGAG